MNDNNLINLRDRTPEERKEIARQGGTARQAQRRRRKTLREELKALLSDPQLQQELCTALVGKALTGSASAFATIRDTIGEKPVSAVEVHPTLVTPADLDNLTEDERAILGRLVGGLLDMNENVIDVSAPVELSVDAKSKLLSDLI